MLKKLVPQFFDKEEYVLQLYLRLGLKLKNTLRIRAQSITMVKTIYEIQHTKKNGSRKNGHKDEKALYKSMNNAIYGKGMEIVKNRINVKLVDKEKDYLKSTSKPSYMSHKTFDSNFNCDTKKQNYIKT